MCLHIISKNEVSSKRKKNSRLIIINQNGTNINALLNTFLICNAHLPYSFVNKLLLNKLSTFYGK